MLQVAQLRAARALLGWRQEDVAQAAKIRLTIRRIESWSKTTNPVPTASMQSGFNL
jgi:hypothetical protein